ncbi:hypothetical protein [Zooshikella harenae]|uniref:N-acetylmuramoyl-L-alanine amidase n=1 Tax=Zooshikella harenae TaxID=2827238 RepID=A0ABS5ZKU8_9GAMM|nr:hypothetical protein [Zooshikella harenae]MBU2713926.1 hypothetical protein [Zooshikella harenae]
MYSSFGFSSGQTSSKKARFMRAFFVPGESEFTMNITKLVVHCADTPNDRDVTAEDIHQWHIQRKWAGIGYHKVIRRDGSIENGRPEL